MKDVAIKHWFYSKLNEEIKRTDSKADRFRWVFYFIRITLVMVAGTITVLSGWKNTALDKESLLNILLLLGTFTTVFTSIDNIFQVETKKNIYRQMLLELRSVRSEFVYFYNSYAKNDSDPESNTVLKERIEKELLPRYTQAMSLAKILLEKEESDQSQNNTSPCP